MEDFNKAKINLQKKFFKLLRTSSNSLVSPPTAGRRPIAIVGGSCDQSGIRDAADPGPVAM
jgi:hypothetical protein